MSSAHDNEGFDSVIDYLDAELGRALDRFGRADAVATSQGNFTQALVLALVAVLAALHRHLGLLPILLIVVGGAVTLTGMLVSALSWNPLRSRGWLSRGAAKLPVRAFTREEVDDISKLISRIDIGACEDDGTVRVRIAEDLKAKLEAADVLAEWSERRAAALALFYGLGVLLLAAGTFLALAHHYH